jgi:hypothetical protein
MSAPLLIRWRPALCMSLLLIEGCGRPNALAERRALVATTQPDLSRVAQSVRAQIAGR